MKEEADKLTDYAVEVRYPDDWFEPSLTDAKEAFKTAIKIKGFVEKRMSQLTIGE